MLRHPKTHKKKLYVFDNQEYYFQLIFKRRSQEKIGAYFKLRIQKEKRQTLLCNSNLTGYRDNFPTTFNQTDDYAGRIYNNEKDFNLPMGVEMPTRHLEKLALPPEEFLKYWNDKYPDGRYYWREAFIECLTLLF